MLFLVAQETAPSCKQRMKVTEQGVEIYFSQFDIVCRPYGSPQKERSKQVILRRNGRKDFAVAYDRFGTRAASSTCLEFLHVCDKRLSFQGATLEKNAVVDVWLVPRSICWLECIGERADLRCVSPSLSAWIM